jgi:phage-related protein
MITFAGTSLGDVNIHVQRLSDYVIPERDVTHVSVPGRSGDLLIDNGRYKNFPLDYSVYVLNRTDGVISSLRAFTGKLADTFGSYQRFEDDKDPLVYGMAKFVGPNTWTNYDNVGGESKLSFNFKPYWRLKSGETAITISATDTKITNPTKFPSKPLIKVSGTAAGTITIGEITMTVNSLTDYLYIDCEEQNVYRLTSENMNSCVELGDFCEIPADNSRIYFTGGITSLEITPRWWTL